MDELVEQKVFPVFLLSTLMPGLGCWPTQCLELLVFPRVSASPCPFMVSPFC